MGWVQAPILHPMRVEVERQEQEQEGNPLWPVLFMAHCMIFGVVRFAHAQRSVVHSVGDHSITFWCFKGKTAMTRSGFFWSCPVTL